MGDFRKSLQQQALPDVLSLSGSHVLNVLWGGTQSSPLAALTQLAWEGTSITWEANWSIFLALLFICAGLFETLLDMTGKSILSLRKC